MSDPKAPLPLAQRNCTHRNSADERLSSQAISGYLTEVKGWEIIAVEDQDCLEKQLMFKNFEQALWAAQRVGRLADEQDHHPWLGVEWGRLTIRWWTHSVNGISENDFIMAAKVDQILEN